MLNLSDFRNKTLFLTDVFKQDSFIETMHVFMCFGDLVYYLWTLVELVFFAFVYLGVVFELHLYWQNGNLV